MKTAARISLRAAAVAALVCVASRPLTAQTTVLSSPVGVTEEVVPTGTAGFSFPLIGADVFVGVVASNGGGSLHFPDSEGNVGALLASAGRYFVEVATGPLEGERLDVDTAATIAAAGPSILLELGDDTHSTLGALPADALAGARCVVRAHLTLADLPGMFTPALEGDRHAHKADAVLILGERGFERFHLAQDGESWRDEDDRRNGPWGRRYRAWCGRHRRPEPTDYRGLVIPPDVSVIIDVNSGCKTWTNEGLVRTNAFRKNLTRGLQAFASGFPMDLAPVQIGAYVDPAVPPGERWVGNNLFPFADQIEILCSQRRPLALYFLRGDGHTWVSLARSVREDFAGVPILGDGDMILVRRRNPDAGFVIARPFEL